MNGIHILKPKWKKICYKVRFPYQRKFGWKEYRTKRGAINAALTGLKELTIDFIEVYEILVDENPYYEPTQRLVARLFK